MFGKAGPLRHGLALLAGLSVLLATGGHWMVLQSVAWAGMLVSYAQDRSLSEAISDTFDGQHPCDLCTAIEQARQSEQQDQPLPADSLVKKIFGVLWAEQGLAPVAQPSWVCEANAARTNGERPPPPLRPPRGGWMSA